MGGWLENVGLIGRTGRRGRSEVGDEMCGGCKEGRVRLPAHTQSTRPNAHAHARTHHHEVVEQKVGPDRDHRAVLRYGLVRKPCRGG